MTVDQLGRRPRRGRPARSSPAGRWSAGPSSRSRGSGPAPPRKRWSLTPSASIAVASSPIRCWPELVVLVGGEVRELGDEDLALLAERAGDERDVGALGDVLRHRGAVADRLVVGVGVHEQQPAAPSRAPPCCPRPRVRPARAPTPPPGAPPPPSDRAAAVALSGSSAGGPSGDRRHAQRPYLRATTAWAPLDRLPMTDRALAPSPGSTRAPSGFTRGAPRSLQLDPTGARLTVPALGARHRPGRRAVVDRRRDRRRDACVADPRALLAGGERAAVRRRSGPGASAAGEGAAGIVGYATDRDATVAAFALSSRLWLADLGARRPTVRELPAVGAVIDPRPDPTGTLGRLRGRRRAARRGASTAGGRTARWPRRETDRSRWGWPSSSPPRRWAATAATGGRPDGDALLAARVDEAPVQRWYIADPAHPDRRPPRSRYPAAGSANADVTLHVLRLDGARAEVDLGPRRVPLPRRRLLVAGRQPLVQVMSRDQRHAAGPARSTRPPGRPRCCASRRDPSGSTSSPACRPCCPTAAWSSTADRRRRPPARGRRRAGHRPDGCRSTSVLVGRRRRRRWSPATDDPTEQHLWRWTPDGGVERLTDAGRRALGARRGRHGGRRQRRRRPSRADRGASAAAAHEPRADRRRTPRRRRRCRGPRFYRVGDARPRDRRRAARADHVPGTPLPVLMDPYGGPHHREVARQPDALAARRSGSPTRASPSSSRRRPRHRRPRAGLGPRGPGRVRHGHARGPGRGAARGRPTWCPTST